MVRTTARGSSDRSPAATAVAHERVHVTRGARSGLTVVVAVHSTALGPAIGGCRFRRYPAWRDGLADALELSAAMTDKCSMAGLPHGGGKTVAVLPPEPLDPRRRTDLIEDIADVIADLRGSYITGPDIGTGPDDMQLIYERTGSAFCRPTSTGGAGDSALPTARGVVAAMTAAAGYVFGDRSLRHRRIGMIGLGGVGTHLARHLVECGAELTVTDIDPGRRAVAVAMGATWAEPDDLLVADHEILVPAAGGGLLTEDVVDTLRCRLIVGPANNQLRSAEIADRLGARGIEWIPDVVAGAGGVVHAVAVEEHACDEQQATARVDAIGETVAALHEEADRTGTTLATVARDVAAQRIEWSQRRISTGRHPDGAAADAAVMDWPAESSTRTSYDTVASTYADRFSNELAVKPLDRALLHLLADDAGPGAPVLDLGCGPGHVSAHLAELGLRPVGIDLSPRMIEIARVRHPDLEFRCASMLDIPDTGPFAAAVALYSLIHLDPSSLQRALRGIRAVLVTGAPFLLAFHCGTDVRHVDQLWGAPVDLDFRFFQPGELRRHLERADFRTESTTEREPYTEVEVATHRAYILARAR